MCVVCIHINGHVRELVIFDFGRCKFAQNAACSVDSLFLLYIVYPWCWWCVFGVAVVKGCFVGGDQTSLFLSGCLWYESGECALGCSAL